ncbi:MAG: hypothetical protein P9X24_07815 [Candidatus Hatepunaea meridiana]|nr:hypothetical protein [Candidatus Hatepunaea meridiana]
MSELRYDALQRKWVIIVPDHQQRLQDFYARREKTISIEDCSFCPDNENRTPPEIAAIRSDDSLPNDPDWRVRVIPNVTAALEECTITWEPGTEGFYECIPGYGFHEIIIEGQDHNKDMASFPLDLTLNVLQMYRDRLSTHLENSNIKYVLIHKNHNITAHHPQSHVIATPITPRIVRIELMSTLRYHAETGNCMICDMVDRERNDDSRIIYDDGNFVAFNSFAPCFPIELIITPVKHEAYYNHEDDQTLEHLARCLKDVLSRLKIALDDPAYILILHSAPNIEAPPIYPGYWKTLGEDFHWHIEIIPRLTEQKNLEWGSGLHINPISPETAASSLREVSL